MALRKAKKSMDKGSIFSIDGFSNHVVTSIDAVIKESYPEIDFEDKQFESKAALVHPGTIAPGLSLSAKDNLDSIYGPAKVLKPKYHPLAMRDLAEGDPDVSAAIEAYAVNIGGVSWSIEPNIPIKEYFDENNNLIRERTDTREKISPELWRDMQNEKNKIISFINNLCPRLPFRKLRMMKIRNRETIGNTFWEVIRNVDGDLLGFDPVKDDAMIRLCEEDWEPYENFERIVVEGTELKTIPMDWVFRRYAKLMKNGQIKYFKSYMDPRFVDESTGSYYEMGKQPPNAKPAKELIHFRTDIGIDYGVPKFTSNTFGIQTNKSAALTDRETMSNSGIPKMAVILRNFKDKSLETSLKSDFKRIKDSGSKEQILVIRTPPGEIGVGVDAKQIENEIRFERLGELQEKEGIYLKNREYNSSKTQICLRIPDLLLGKSDSNLNRATAFIMKSNVEAQVFHPARQDDDDFMNREIFPQMGFRYHKFVSSSIDMNDTELYIRLLELYANYGGALPNDLRKLGPELLGIDLPQLEEAWAQIPKHIAILQQKVINDNAQAVQDNPPLSNQGDDAAQQAKNFIMKYLIAEMIQADDNRVLYAPPANH